jgi:hypothetical protein
MRLSAGDRIMGAAQIAKEEDAANTNNSDNSLN